MASGLIFFPVRFCAATLGAMIVAGPAARAAQGPELPSFSLGGLAAQLSPNTCSTSGCHGGAEPKRNQYWAWSLHDVHSRSYATLTTARSERMAEALKIERATSSTRCTTCHAPLHAAHPQQPLAEASPTLGVTCVSCHGPSENWLRSHIRPDYTHADRAAAGMRDLRNLYGRANACVACHQNIDPELVKVGRHPELLFELDGQTQSQPKHWQDALGTGAQAWFVGQAVALREVSWALRERRADAEREVPRWEALRWIVERAAPQAGLLAAPASDAAFADTVTAADAIARKAAADWSSSDATAILRRLAATHGDFRGANVSPLVHASRAERLVLALDRLLGALPEAQRPAAASPKLDALFRLVQSKPDFVPAEFARALADFAQTWDGT
jgi:hypothetical protein